MLKLSFRDLRAHAARYLLTFLAVAIGVSFMSGVNTLTDTITRTVDELFAQANDGIDVWVRGTSQFEASSAQLGGNVPRRSIDGALTERVAGLDGVAEAEAMIEGYARLIGPDGEPYGKGSFGVLTYGRNWMTSERLSAFELVEGGRAPEGPDQVVIDKGTADDTGYIVGDTASVQTARGVREVRITGIATFGDADSAAGISFVFFDEPTAEELLAQAPGQVNGIGVVAARDIDPVVLRDAVAASVGSQVEVITGDELTEESRDSAQQNVSYLRTFLLVFALISVAVGSFVIYTSFSFIIAQRQRQMALLRALGASRRQVLTAIVCEALLVGLLASAAGYMIGVGLALSLTGLIVTDGATTVVLDADTALLAMSVGVAVTFCSAFVPAWRGSKVPPVAALRDVAIDHSHRSRGRTRLGLLILALGAVVLGRGAIERDIAWAGGGALATFTAMVVLGPVAARPASMVLGSPLPVVRGIIGRLAQQNAARNARRTASTAAALMIGLGIVSLVLVANASVRASIDSMIDEQFAGDYVINGGAVFGVGGIPPEVATDVAALPEVDSATGIRFGFGQVDGDVALVGGLDTRTAFRLFDVEVVDGDPRALAPDEVAILDEVARDHGWAVGDTIDMGFTDTGVRPLRVAALLGSGDLSGDYVMDIAGFSANFIGTADVQVWIALADGVDPAAARSSIEAITDEFPTAELQDLDGFKESTKAQFDPILVLINVLLALTVLVAVVGIVNTLVLSVIERRREIGLVRAVGALRSQVRATVRWEALLISTFGMAAALACGIAFGWVLVRSLASQGFSHFAVPGTQLAAVTGVMLLLTLLASVVPAIWAGRRDILAAIATD